MTSNPVVPRYTVELVREKSIKVEEYERVGNSATAARIFRSLTETKDRELLMVATMDSKNKLIGVNIVSMGSLSASILHPREILKMAVLQNAAAIIMGHNHPSGDPSPSTDDAQATVRVHKACEIMGIKFLDSLIVVADSEQYFSFADTGRLQQ